MFNFKDQKVTEIQPSLDVFGMTRPQTGLRSTSVLDLVWLKMLQLSLATNYKLECMCFPQVGQFQLVLLEAFFSKSYLALLCNCHRKINTVINW